MPIEGQYQTYYGIHLRHYSYTWGGSTYNKLLTKEYPSEELKSAASSNTTTADFLYPKLVGNPAYMDGIAEGHITLFNSSSGASATIDDYTVTLYKTDNVPSNETQVGSYSQTLTSYNVAFKKDETDGDQGSDTLVLPIYMPINKKKIDVDEKLFLRITFSSAQSSDVWIGHYNGTDPDDIKIKIPYAPTG